MRAPLGAWVHIDGASYRIGVVDRDRSRSVVLGLEPGGDASVIVWRRFSQEAVDELMAAPHRR